MPAQSMSVISRDELIAIFGVHYSVHTQFHRVDADKVNRDGHSCAITEEIGSFTKYSNKLFDFKTYQEAEDKFNLTVLKEINYEKKTLEAQRKSIHGRIAMMKYNMGLLKEKNSSIVKEKLERLDVIDKLLASPIPLVYEPIKEECKVFSEYPKEGETYYLVSTYFLDNIEIETMKVVKLFAYDYRNVWSSQELLNQYDFVFEANLAYEGKDKSHIALNSSQIAKFNGDYYEDSSYRRFIFKDKEKAKAFLIDLIEKKKNELQESLDKVVSDI